MFVFLAGELGVVFSAFVLVGWHSPQGGVASAAEAQVAVRCQGA